MDSQSTSLTRGQLIFHLDFTVPKDHPLLDELFTLRQTISQQLAIPTSEEPIHVYLYESSESYYTQANKYFPGTTARRAFFVENSTRLNVYAQWGNSAAEDLRHELTHGYLHASLRNLPLWLDEGLAEYFEVSPVGGVNAAHITLLKQQATEDTWSPDITRLEALSSAATMTQQDYAEAWLWTHWLLSSTSENKRFLQKYLHTLRLDGSAPPLSLKLREHDSLPHKSLKLHWEKLSSQSLDTQLEP